MEAEAAKLLGAGIAMIALAGVGIGMGNIFASLISSIARNPSARDEVFGIGILGLCGCDMHHVGGRGNGGVALVNP